MTQLLNRYPNPMLLYLFNLLEQLYFLGNYETFIEQFQSVGEIPGEDPSLVEKGWSDLLQQNRREANEGGRESD